MKHKSEILRLGIVIIIMVFNILACSNSDNGLFQFSKSKERIPSSILDAFHMIGDIGKIYEQFSESECTHEKFSDTNKDNYSVEVIIERMDQSIYDEEGRLIAIVYYDKPVIQGDSEAVKKINAYFDNEAEAFYDRGTGISWLSQINFYEDFKNGMELMKERWGNEMLSQHPTHYTMDTRVCYMDEDIISIVQVWNYNLEHNNWHCYGSTFDLRTGELIPITKLISIKPEEMKAIFLITGNIIDIGVYEVLKDDNYVIDDCGHRIDMKYEYFYDGESYYLINEFALEFRTSLVIKWNGKWGENLEVTELYYYTDRTTGQIACREPGMS